MSIVLGFPAFPTPTIFPSRMPISALIHTVSSPHDHGVARRQIEPTITFLPFRGALTHPVTVNGLAAANTNFVAIRGESTSSISATSPGIGKIEYSRPLVRTIFELALVRSLNFHAHIAKTPKAQTKIRAALEPLLSLSFYRILSCRAGTALPDNGHPRSREPSSPQPSHRSLFRRDRAHDSVGHVLMP